MNVSTLPPLLDEYLPSNEEKPSITHARHEVPSADKVKEDELHSTEGDKKKIKPSRVLQAQKRQMEAEEKAFNEREKKALHTLKMWNVVKHNERKRKQKLLKDRVNLQHEIIKKQDELHEVLVEQQQREEKEQIQSPCMKFEKPKTSPSKTVHIIKPQRKSNRNKAHKNKNNIVDEHSEENKFAEVCDEEKPREFLERDTFSEEDLSEFLEHTMEEADFRELRHQPLNVQLERLFGEKADSYLHPAMKESLRKAPNPALVKQKGHYGATALWDSLRDFSRQKLRNKDALILPDVKNAYACFTRECLRRHITPVKRNFVSEEESVVDVNIEESDLLKDVRYRRHRQDLMYRIAHINKDKTRLLFQNSEPHYIDVKKTNDGLRRFYPQLAQTQSDQNLPSITVNNDNLLHITYNNQVAKTEQRRVIEKHPQFSGCNLVFLTEAKASCKGQFAQRLMKEGDSRGHVARIETVGMYYNGAKKHELTQRLCEPLSMEALISQKSLFLEKLDNYPLRKNFTSNVAT